MSVNTRTAVGFKTVKAAIASTAITASTSAYSTSICVSARYAEKQLRTASLASPIITRIVGARGARPSRATDRLA